MVVQVCVRMYVCFSWLILTSLPQIPMTHFRCERGAVVLSFACAVMCLSTVPTRQPSAF
jgi:hypothetical protein